MYDELRVGTVVLLTDGVEFELIAQNKLNGAISMLICVRGRWIGEG